MHDFVAYKVSATVKCIINGFGQRFMKLYIFVCPLQHNLGAGSLINRISRGSLQRGTHTPARDKRLHHLLSLLLRRLCTVAPATLQPDRADALTCLNANLAFLARAQRCQLEPVEHSPSVLFNEPSSRHSRARGNASPPIYLLSGQILSITLSFHLNFLKMRCLLTLALAALAAAAVRPKTDHW